MKLQWASSTSELINEDKIVIGGEEPAGLSIKDYSPEKDGILACLLAAEAVAAGGKGGLTQQLEEFTREGGIGNRLGGA